MRPFASSRRFTAATAVLAAGIAFGVAAGFGLSPTAVASLHPHRLAATAAKPTVTEPTVTEPTVTTPRKAARSTAAEPTTTATTATTTRVVVAPAPTRHFDTGNPRLDALLATLPAVLFEAGAHIHFGFNPLDTCCHAGGYNPGPNDVWVSAHALASNAELTYVTVHELGHSLHLHTARGPALTAAVAGAPVVRAGSPWDVSEKVADCVAWVLYPVQTAASGITYWNCPDPWRSQVRAALQ